MRFTTVLHWLFILSIGLAACQSTPLSTSTLIPSPSPTKTLTPAVPPATIPPSPSATLQAASSTSTSAPTAVEASATPTSLPACVTLFYENNAQVEIISSQGGRVLVDVYDPERLSSASTADDILLTTHTHWDHINDGFLKDFAGQQLFTQEGKFALPWVNIRGIASAHNAGDALEPESGTNYIYLLEIGGLRLAHFGDIGQDAFTAEQLAALQPLDIAIIQIANSYSDMDAKNQKGLKLIAQLNPRLVIPTHANLDTATLAVAQWPGLVSEKTSVQLCKDQLPAKTQILFLGEWTQKFPKYLALTSVDW